ITSLSTDDAKGQGIYTIEPYKIGGIYPKTREERELIAYENIPPGLVSALLSTEDRDFFTHFGIAPLAIARAMYLNVMAGRVVQGGSTLTQQLVKNFYLTRERSIVRKINEAFMALMLEWHYSKEDILETYVNDIYLGQSGNTAVHGFAMASRFYFARNLENLELEQHALLVGLLKGP
ncbi:transglycosylase domain-containing protein, partial [Oleiphilus sp. HI0066]|uniref:transglycosylase domain-containing protein n=4 Tax=Oleiphilus TaxID=141450 RepID=UPI000A998301